MGTGWKGSRLRLAALTLYDETVEFRFSYPLMLIADAGPKNSLHYYIFKYAPKPPKRTVVRFDPEGIVQTWSRVTGQVYRPGFIAAHALSNLERYLLSKNPEHLEIFLNHVGWLEQHAVKRRDGAIVWHHNFTYREGPVNLESPWISANTQRLVISALVRAWRHTRDPRLLPLLDRSTRIFELDPIEDGVRVRADGHTLYAEIPSLPAPGIMDGFMRSLLGLYDLYEETGEPSVGRLFQEGVLGLRHFLPEWDYRNKWSMYSNRQYLCPPNYHCLNRMLLTVLANITGDKTMSWYARAWDPANLSTMERAEIYAAFLWTKNACRVRYRSWRQPETKSDQTNAHAVSGCPA
jgi:hypothetical protein